MAYISGDHGNTITITKGEFTMLGYNFIDKIFRKHDPGFIADMKTAFKTHPIRFVSMLPYDESGAGTCTVYNDDTGFQENGRNVSMNQLYLKVFFYLKEFELAPAEELQTLRRIMRSAFYYKTIKPLYYEFMANPELIPVDEIKLLINFLRSPEDYAKEWMPEGQEYGLDQSTIAEYKEYSNTPETWLKPKYGPFGLTLSVNVGGENILINLHEEVFNPPDGLGYDPTTGLYDSLASANLSATVISHLITMRVTKLLNITNPVFLNAINSLVLSTIRIVRKKGLPTRAGGGTSLMIRYSIFHFTCLSILLGQGSTLSIDLACSGDTAPRMIAEESQAMLEAGGGEEEEEEFEINDDTTIPQATPVPAPEPQPEPAGELFDNIINGLFDLSKRVTRAAKSRIKNELPGKVDRLNRKITAEAKMFFPNAADAVRIILQEREEVEKRNQARGRERSRDRQDEMWGEVAKLVGGKRKTKRKQKKHTKKQSHKRAKPLKKRRTKKTI